MVDDDITVIAGAGEPVGDSEPGIVLSTISANITRRRKVGVDRTM